MGKRTIEFLCMIAKILLFFGHLCNTFLNNREVGSSLAVQWVYSCNKNIFPLQRLYNYLRKNEKKESKSSFPRIASSSDTILSIAPKIRQNALK